MNYGSFSAIINNGETEPVFTKAVKHSGKEYRFKS